jgi:hypothetical protein
MNKTISDNRRVRTVAEGKDRLRQIRFAKTVEGKRKAAEDAASSTRQVLEKLRQITYGTGFDWENRFVNAPRYTDQAEQEGGLALSPVAASTATTDAAFVEILHECNALCTQQMSNSTSLEINANEYEALLRRYSDYKGRIRWRKFLNDLAIGPPADYLDPDLQFDLLPQPYRLLNDIVVDLYDEAWDLIEKKTGITSSSASSSSSSSSSGSGDTNPVGPQSVASRSLFYPTSVSKRLTSNIGYPAFIAPCPGGDGGRVVMGTDEGELLIFDTKSDELVAMTIPFPDSATGITCMSRPTASDRCANDSLPLEPHVVVVVASRETKEERKVRYGAVAERVRAAEAEVAAAAAGATDGEDGGSGGGKKDKGKGKDKGKKGKGKGGGEEEVVQVETAFDPGSVLTVYEVWPREPTFVSFLMFLSSSFSLFLFLFLICSPSLCVATGCLMNSRSSILSICLLLVYHVIFSCHI